MLRRMRFFGFVLGIAVLAYVGYRAMFGVAPGARGEQEAPAQRLENVRNAAGRIEQQQQEAAERALKQSQAE